MVTSPEHAQEPKADVVIVTALPLERDAVLKYLPATTRHITKHRVYYHTELLTERSWRYNVVLLSMTAMGNVPAAAATTQAIDVWNPEVLILTGIAGGFRGGLKGQLGDLIVAEQIVGYEPGKIYPNGTKRRYDVFRSSHRLLNAAKNFSNEKWTYNIKKQWADFTLSGSPGVHFGVVTSGEKVVTDSRFLKDLAEHWPRLLGVEMEGVGVAMAAYEAEQAPDLLVVKAISDWADESKDDRSQSYAADVAATYTCAFLQSGPIEPSVERPQPRRITGVQLTGKHKIRMCQRLGDDWYDVADYYEIPRHKRAQFPQGKECQSIWEWLEQREKLESLPAALEFIDRHDLAELLRVPSEV